MTKPRQIRDSNPLHVIARDGCWLVLPLLALVMLTWTAPRMTNAAVLVAVGLIGALLFIGGWPLVRLRREVWVRDHFRADSVWHGRLRRAWWARGVSLFSSLILGGALLTALARQTGATPLLVVFILNVPVLVCLRALFERWLWPHLLPEVREAVALRAAMVVDCAGVLVILLAGAFLARHPDYASLPLAEAVRLTVSEEQARSAALTLAMQLAAAKDAVVGWLGQQFLPGSGPVALQFAGWVIVLATDAVVAWSYVRLMAASLWHAPWRRAARRRAARDLEATACVMPPT